MQSAVRQGMALRPNCNSDSTVQGNARHFRQLILTTLVKSIEMKLPLPQTVSFDFVPMQSIDTQVVWRWTQKDLAAKDIVISPAAEQQVDYSHLLRDFRSLSTLYQAAVSV